MPSEDTIDCYKLEYNIDKTFPYMSQFSFGYGMYRHMLIIAICDMLMPLFKENPQGQVSVKFKLKSGWIIKDERNLLNRFPLLNRFLDKICQTCYYPENEEDDEEWYIDFLNNYEWVISDHQGAHGCGLDLEKQEDYEQLQVTRMLVGFYDY